MSDETPQAPKGDRIAKMLSRAGLASRRDAERMIAEGRVRVNGAPIDSPALNVTPADRITVDGKPVEAPQPARLWLYHKPSGLVTSARDEKGRETVFDTLPEDLPRVMSVGRLDLTSEGLLLLTNDGGLKRRLELPSTGWMRRYRVRVKGSPSEDRLAELRAGITVEGVDYQPMEVRFDRVQGANSWLTVAIREGKNREIRRAMDAIGATVLRLIRISYGPFQLGTLESGAVEEVRPRILREQLGQGLLPEAEAPRQVRRGPRKPSAKDAAKLAAKSGPGKAPRSPNAPSSKVKPSGGRTFRSKTAASGPAGERGAPAAGKGAGPGDRKRGGPGGKPGPSGRRGPRRDG
ncbi:pseudouridine synthase [Pseudoroseicyclus aestuarii]|uniref:Pseudouridine synthase n=1 Tax=Pseudoroseicyclus aestuarii TaxID=1795041 RepID=A0A318SMU3_9RHOB|nr:pseudouridine synthase [Pseudoroseicyclus aestuarii]PYE81273.1 pseudouridine synthase [Pseudoroseicyclus aestuarii]